MYASEPICGQVSVDRRAFRISGPLGISSAMTMAGRINSWVSFNIISQIRSSKSADRTLELPITLSRQETKGVEYYPSMRADIL